MDRDDAFWNDLATRTWRRVKWRKDGPQAALARCVAYDRPIHRTGTYYVRPAYTDGEVWLCQQAYAEMIHRTQGRRPSRRYSQTRDEPKGGEER